MTAPLHEYFDMAVRGILQKYDEDISTLGEECTQHERSLADVEDRLRELIRTINSMLVRLKTLENLHPSIQTPQPIVETNYNSGRPWTIDEERALMNDLRDWLQYRNSHYHHRTPLALAIRLRDKLIREICREL